jgi:hypothetical protein
VATQAQASRAAVLQGLADGESEDDDAENEVVGYLEDEEKEAKKDRMWLVLARAFPKNVPKHEFKDKYIKKLNKKLLKCE